MLEVATAGRHTRRLPGGLLGGLFGCSGALREIADFLFFSLEMQGEHVNSVRLKR